MIEMVWAMDENRLIGKGNKLPWHLPKDLKHFKAVVGTKAVLMGDQTYQSLKSYYQHKPLPFSKIYVATLDDTQYEDAIRIDDLITFLNNVDEDLMVIGGKTIYQLALPFADRLHITYVLDAYEGDVHFPLFDMSPFGLISKKHDDKLIFTTYERVKKQ
ncbi:MAG: dihydrofolate reductase [Acholeplasmataceae bacterium]|nr:dihydrofolate reductase [Acholeplasmataceae bacterium]